MENQSASDLTKEGIIKTTGTNTKSSDYSRLVLMLVEQKDFVYL